MHGLCESIDKKDTLLIKWSPRITEYVDRLNILHDIYLARTNMCKEFNVINVTYVAKFYPPSGNECCRRCCLRRGEYRYNCWEEIHQLQPNNSENFFMFSMMNVFKFSLKQLYPFFLVVENNGHTPTVANGQYSCRYDCMVSFCVHTL